MVSSKREIILKRLKEIEDEKQSLLAKLELIDQGPKKTSSLGEMTPSEKVKLFRNLFKGREDVYARRWENSKTNKSGYSPAKKNKETLLPITDEVIKNHLQGQDPKEPLFYGKKQEFVMGIYPLLLDETCCFLAVDFDKSGWQKDVRFFIQTCEELEVPVYIERSRSGNGAHLWIFFEEPLSAYEARRLGSFLLTLTMEKHPEIGFSSYDRLFPNQDTMPKGGFGNLIALPLQYKARQNNNSVFVDKEFNPYSDQWQFLNNVKRMNKLHIKKILEKYVDLNLNTSFIDEDQDKPWAIPAKEKEDFKDISLPTAEVEGNYDNYEIEINFKKLSSKQIETLVKVIKSNPEISSELSNGNLPYKLFELLEEENIYIIPNSFDSQGFYCDCLDDIRPCKHIIAVYYVLSQEISEKPLRLFELNGIPLKELFEKIEIPLGFEYKAEKTLKQKMQERLKTLLDKADKAKLKEIIFDLTFRSKENYIKYLDIIEDKIGLEDNKTTEVSSEKFMFNWDKLKWKLKKIEEYGYDFDYDEAESLDIEDKFNEIIEELEKKEASKESRKEFIDEALSYVNSDFGCEVMDTIYAACYDKDELYYFAENIRNSSPTMAMKVYKQLSEKEEYLKLRLGNLESNSDYYDLVQFYEENNEPQKAIKTAYEGLQKVQYYKGDLQEYLAGKALDSNNREEYLKLKFDKYTDRLTFQDYKNFEAICNAKEWQQYEPEILSKLEKLNSSDKLLIYMHRKEFEKAANTLLEDYSGYYNFRPNSISFSVADKLKNKYPEKVLQFYLNSTGDLDSAKDRKIYANQALIVLKIRDMWINVLKIPEKWLNFVKDVKSKNKNRKAFQEEFNKVIPDWKNL